MPLTKNIRQSPMIRFFNKKNESSRLPRKNVNSIKDLSTRGAQVKEKYNNIQQFFVSTFVQKLKRQKYLIENLITNPNFWLIFFTDIFLIILSYSLAWSVRFSGDLIAPPYNLSLSLLTLIICIKLLSFHVFEMYRGLWRYISYVGLLNIMKGVFLAEILVVVVLLYGNCFQEYSRFFFILDAFFTFSFIAGERLAIRYFHNKKEKPFVLKKEYSAKKRLLLIGTGSAAEKVLRELKENKELPYLPMGIVDDNTSTIGLKIHGTPVVGLLKDIKEHAFC
ncbi:MAG: hypothetical protein D3923_00725, partial [Candidatus Electrothrix sp. AR3]|nr:hypothetical protein [Candidatus Electrothrix sp. AR3]